MTGNNTKVRAVFLAALMVLSVFAGTVAFAGSAAAANTTGDAEYAGGAVEYDNDTSSSTNWIIEVPLESGTVSDATANKSNITLLDDGDDVTSSAVSSVSTRSGGGAIVLDLNGQYASNDLEVEFDDSFESNLAGSTIDVEFAANTIQDAGSGGISGGNVTAFQGETIAVVGAPGTVPLEGDDDSNSGYFQSFQNGTNSSVFYINTGGLSGDYTYNGSDDVITVRDLGLSVSIDDLNVSNEAGNTIEGTVTAVDSGRPITVELLDSAGDTVATDTGSLSGQGEFDFSFSADRDTGEYTVQVTDNNTQIQVESSTISISEAQDDDAGFVTTSITEQRGDIVEMTVQMESTDFASISVGGDDQGVEANVTVEDESGDGQVTLYLNTYKLGPPAGAAGGSQNPFDIDDDSEDSIDHWNVATNTTNLIDAGEYDLEVTAGDQQYAAAADGVATLVLNERSTQSIRMWTGSKEAISPSNLEDVNQALANNQITQSSEIATGDYAVHQVVATGLEGALEARANEDVTSQFQSLVNSGPLNLTIEEADPGANQDAAELELGYGDNVTVIADGENDTYYIIVDTGAVNFKSGSPRNGEALPTDEDTALETNFTVLQDDAGFDFTPDGEFDDDENSETFASFTAAEPEITINEPYNVSQASGQTISGTTNIAPGTEMTLRVRSQSGVSPSFLKTASPVVQPDGTFSATFDFSGQNVGDEYDIVADANPVYPSDTSESGTVVEAVTTTTATPEPDTATPEPDTATPEPETDTATPEPETDTATPMPETDTPTSTPTSTPGFGVVVALTALLAAALLAIRRD